MRRIVGQVAIDKSEKYWELLYARAKSGACMYISLLVLKMAFEIVMYYLNFLIEN